MSIFTGAGVAIVTPFTSDGKVNYPALKEILEYQIANSTDCIVICGCCCRKNSRSSRNRKQ